MESQPEQLLRECARRDLGKSQQACGPCPPSHLQYAHAVPVDQCFLPAHAIEMVKELMSEKNRRGRLDAQIEARPSGYLSIEATYRWRVKRDRWRADRVFRVNHRTPEAGLVATLHDRYIAAASDNERICSPLLACLLGETASILQSHFDPFASLRFRDAMELHIAAQRQQPECGGCGSDGHIPRAPCTVMSATGASGASPSSSLRPIARTCSNALTPERSTTRRPAITNMSGVMTLSPL